MKKTREIVYPGKRENQVDFIRAVNSMVNVIKYLKENSSDFLPNGKYSGIGGRFATIVFSDGSVVDSGMFYNTKNKLPLLERIVEKEAVFKPLQDYSKYSGQEPINIRYCMDDTGYSIDLRVIDTTKSKKAFPSLRSPSLFSFHCSLSLNKPVIDDEDIKQFETYSNGIEEAALQENDSIKTPLPNNSDVVSGVLTFIDESIKKIKSYFG